MKLDDLPFAPQWLEDLCGHAKPRDAQATTVPLSPLDDVAAIERATSWLREQAPVSVQGDGGDDTAYRVAAKIKDFGLSEPQALDSMLEHWNERCSPPWDPEELQRKVANAYDYGTRAPGAAHPMADFEVLEGPVPFSSILAREPQPVHDLIDGLFEKGTANFLAGVGGSNKSRFLLQAGLCVNAGAPVIGLRTEQCRFLLLSSEDDESEIVRRTHAIVKRLDLPRDTQALYWDRRGMDSALALVRPGKLTLQPFYTELRDYLRALPGHTLVGFDSCYDFVRFSEGGKIDEGAVNIFCKGVLDRLCIETDSTAVVVWHPSQAGADRGDNSGWSVAWHNAPRLRASLRADEKGSDRYLLRIEKRNHGPAGREWALHWSEGTLIPPEAQWLDEQRASLRAAVLSVAERCAEAGAPFTRQKNPNAAQIKSVSDKTGAPITTAEIRNELDAALLVGEMIYVNATYRQIGGFYPPARAEELSRRRKEK